MLHIFGEKDVVVYKARLAHGWRIHQPAFHMIYGWSPAGAAFTTISTSLAGLLCVSTGKDS